MRQLQWVGVVALVLAGCTGAVDRDGVGEGELGLTVTEDTESVFEGRYENGVSAVAFRSELVGEVNELLVILDGETTLGLKVHESTRTLEVDAGVALTAAQTQALGELAATIQDRYPAGEADRRLVTLERAASYWAEAPVGHVIPSRSLTTEGTEEAIGTKVEALSGCGVLQAGQALYPGQALYSCNGGGVLSYQGDGNVVLYRTSDWAALWSTGTNGRASTALVMQWDGNLVLYNGSQAIWASNSSYGATGDLAVQDDCNLVIYDRNGSARWHTGSWCPSGAGDDGIACLDDRTGQWITARWDDGSGYHTENVQVGACWGTNPYNGGNYDCMGRCGAGCGSWYAKSGWTQDCLDHDACSYRNNASGGGSDPNCGDEYDEAQDDWWDATWVGCSGSKNPLGC